MTREEMQTQAMIIENLLNAAMALFAGDSPEDGMNLIEMACNRAEKLNQGLDIVNAPEVEA